MDWALFTKSVYRMLLVAFNYLLDSALGSSLISSMLEDAGGAALKVFMLVFFPLLGTIESPSLAASRFSSTFYWIRSRKSSANTERRSPSFGPPSCSYRFAASIDSAIYPLNAWAKAASCWLSSSIFFFRYDDWCCCPRKDLALTTLLGLLPSRYSEFISFKSE